MEETRLEKQLRFLVEVDKLKQVLRQTLLIDGSRRENDAEHSWHFALMAVVLHEYAGSSDIDMTKVLKMALIHDLIEIYAGDTFAYDEQANLDKEERENQAADTLFQILPKEQGLELRALWEEFDAIETPEAKFAAAIDRIQPLIHNYYTQGHTWKIGPVTSEKVYTRMAPIKEGMPALWPYVEHVIEDSIQKGYLLR